MENYLFEEWYFSVNFYGTTACHVSQLPFSSRFEEKCILRQITRVITDRRNGSTQSLYRAVRFVHPIEGVILSFTGQVGWNLNAFSSNAWQIIVVFGEIQNVISVRFQRRMFTSEEYFFDHILFSVKLSTNCLDVKLKCVFLKN